MRCSAILLVIDYWLFDNLLWAAVFIKVCCIFMSHLLHLLIYWPVPPFYWYSWMNNDQSLYDIMHIMVKLPTHILGWYFCNPPKTFQCEQYFGRFSGGKTTLDPFEKCLNFLPILKAIANQRTEKEKYFGIKIFINK